MTKPREEKSDRIIGPGRVAVLWDVTWRVRRNLESALTELRIAQQERAFFATTRGLEAAPMEDRVTAHAVCRAEPCARRDSTPAVPGL